MGTVHEVHQGEGGEQGDAMMPLLFSFGQTPSLGSSEPTVESRRIALCLLGRPARVGVVHTLLEHALWGHARIQVHAGKTKVWNRAGVRPEACDFLERRAQLVVESARVWRGGDEAGTVAQGIKILGMPLGHPDFVHNQLQHVREHQQTLLGRIPLVPDVQSCWALLLHCVAARANYFIRVVPPELSAEFATSHDNALWMCLSRVLDVPPDACTRSAKDAVSLPLAFGGMGVRSAARTAVPACWASWGDVSSMISQRHRAVATTLVHELSGHSTSAHFNAAARSADQLRGLGGFESTEY